MKLLRRPLLPALALACLSALFTPALRPALADGGRAGVFDYYVLALSWSSAWCASQDAKGLPSQAEPQCRPGKGLTFVLHGLWPQYEKGWPSWCRTTARDPGRSESAAMADLTGGSGIAFYQWKKHGRCSGLSARDYYAKSRAAVESITIPPLFAEVTKSLKLPAEVIESAFLEANPGLKRDQITVTCQEGMIREVRLCLTKDLEPRRCGADVIRDCRMKDAVLEALR